MALASVASFLDDLRRYHVLEATHLDEVAGTLHAGFCGPRELAGDLIRRGWLTPYQANQLLLGRGQDLLLGSYVLLDRLGEGGMGQVFKARSWKLGRTVALKLIRKERLSHPDAVRRFRREIHAAAQLSHPNVVHAYDADEVNGTHFIAMEYVAGTDLARVVKQRGPLPVPEACEYVRQAALGLQHAFDRGLVHRDIKPHNLLLTSQGAVVKVLDMGLARLTAAGDEGESGTVTQEGAVMGTPDYIAPEQTLNSHTADIRADLYSLGCTLYHLLTGCVPFPGGSLGEKLIRHQLHEPVPVEQRRPEVPPAVAALVRKLMAKRPEERYQTPAEAAEALAAALGPSGQSPLRGGADLAATLEYRAATVAAASADTLQSAMAYMARGGDQEAADPPRLPRLSAEARFRLRAGLAGGALLLTGIAVITFLLLKGGAGKQPPTDDKSHAVVAASASNKTLPKAGGSRLEQIAALPPDRQVQAVAARLQALNPGFDGHVTQTVEGGTVTGLDFVTDAVRDISPVLALRGLKKLGCNGSEWATGKLSDLGPLRDLRLTELSCNFNPAIRDLSPLEAMPLRSLEFRGANVMDLSPLHGMPLQFLVCSDTGVRDLGPLRHMPLRRLQCGWTQVSDLSPLRDTVLEALICHDTPVADLRPLRGLPLAHLNCQFTRVRDLTPLKDAPLKVLWWTFQPVRDADVLRSFRSLEWINFRPAKVCLRPENVDPQVAARWRRAVAAMPAEKQVEAVIARLKELNPGSDGKADTRIDQGKVTEFKFSADMVEDLSPVRALVGLRTLWCFGSEGRGGIGDLGPLEGLRLRELRCDNNGILTDLSPLKGMPLAVLTIRHDLRVTDLSPLRGMPLSHLDCANTLVADLSPLKGVALQDLHCDFKPERDAELLRSIATLATINGRPAKDVLKEAGHPAVPRP
ncbi:MAG TPA: protein kinase [Gemmataceae bacterium]|jgi:tRNA A-37 threonylcarbamoyl transferase component Bud32|nr:protein kinase [Gemmataceae bacterium]